MPVRLARGHCDLRYGLSRAALSVGLAAAFLVIGNRNLQTAVAEGDTRTLSFHHVHTGEDITITYKTNGRYDEAALARLNHFMRDWRRDEETKMDPHLFDLLWETYREVNGKEPIQVICGYRSPQTNSMLRARSSGVAQYSLHTQGDAMDFYIPGVPLDEIRNIGLRMQRGGVGFYPTSGSPFVHLDTGSIRHWPRLSHDQLVKVFPNGRTVHVPSDGVPLPGYALALADVERAGHSPNGVSLAAARNAGAIGESEERVAERPPVPTRNLIADVLGFGGNNRDTEKPALPTRAPVAIASLAPPTAVTAERIVPLPKGRPAEPAMVADLAPLPHARPHVAATVVASRAAVPAVEMGPELPAPIMQPVEVASADPIVTASAMPALAYAADTPLPPVRRVPPIGTAMPKLPKTVALPKPAPGAALPKFAFASATMSLDNPWLRATMLTPSTSDFMTVTRMGRLDMRPLREFVHKPESSVVMAFSADPTDGLETGRFTGSAVVFLATATFSSVRTASLAR